MIQRRKPLCRQRKSIKRSPIKKRMTKRKAQLLEKTQGALDIYFSKSTSKPCQVCGVPMLRNDADPAHRWKRHHGRHESHEILAAHRACHVWLDNGAHLDRIRIAQTQDVGCKQGGIITWPTEQYESLWRWLKRGIDPIGTLDRLKGFQAPLAP